MHDSAPLRRRRVPVINPDVAWRHELADMALRARLGGVFYLAGWITVGLADDAPSDHPLVFTLGLLVFATLGLLRLRRPPATVDATDARRWIAQLWMIVWASTGLWSLAAAWVLFTSNEMTARVLVLVLIGAYGTTLSHVYAMRAVHAGLGLGLLFAPQLAVLFWVPGERLLGVSFLIYFVYLVLVMRRARTEYWQRVALEEEIREQRDFFEHQSRRDGLTGLPNRRRFDAALTSLLQRRPGVDGDRDVSLILFDLDHFKTINDRFGHAVGDRCLVAFARCLGEAFNATDELPARLGGEEFAVVLPRCSLTEASTRAELLRQSLARLPIPADDDRILMNVSGGVVTAAPGENADDLFGRADAALYQAKRNGRDRIVATPVDAHARSVPATLLKR
jgi:diguanylate cyclase (GGDEF)-like protein